MNNIQITTTPITITRYAINAYARATDNLHPMYLEQESAAECGLARILVPSCFWGQLSFSKIILGQAEYIPTGGVHIRQSYKLYRPVYEGDKIHIQLQTIQRTDDKGRALLEYRLDFSNQDQELVASSIMVNLLPTSAGGK